MKKKIKSIEEKLLKGVEITDEEWQYYISYEASNQNQTPILLKDYYNNKGHNTYQSLASYVLDRAINKSDNIKILEIGCGEGTLVPYLHLEDKYNWKYKGIDNNKEQIENAKNLFKTNRVNFKALDLSDYKTEESYDFIISHMVIHMLKNYKEVIRHYRNLLSSKGEFVFIVRDKKENKELDINQIIRNKTKNYFKISYPNFTIPENKQKFSKDKLNKICQDTDFDIVEIKELKYYKKQDPKEYIREHLKNVYPSSLLTKTERSVIEERIASDINKYNDIIPLDMRLVSLIAN